MVQVVFSTEYHVNYDPNNQRVITVVGGHPSLGEWDPAKAPRGIQWPPGSGTIFFIIYKSRGEMASGKLCSTNAVYQ